MEDPLEIHEVAPDFAADVVSTLEDLHVAGTLTPSVDHVKGLRDGIARASIEAAIRQAHAELTNVADAEQRRNRMELLAADIDKIVDGAER